MIGLIITVTYLLLVTITYWASTSYTKIVGDKNFSVWLVPYGLFFLLSSPVIMCVEYVLGQKYILNIAQLKEKRAQYLSELQQLELNDEDLEEL